MASEPAGNPLDPVHYHDTLRVYRLSALLSPLFLLAVLALTGPSVSAVGRLRQEGLPELVVRALYLTGLYLCLWAVSMVWGYLAGYRLEKRYGLMRLSLSSWWLRRLKSAGVGLVVFTLGCLAVLWTIDRFGPSWWWIAATVLTLLSWSGALLYPALIVPMFHQLRPLPEGQLRQRLERVCLDCGIRKADLRQIDLSKISRRANAAVMGVASTRKIVLSDTLLDAFTPDEVEFVLYHELGHYAEKHIPLQLVWNSLLTYAALWAGANFLPIAAAGSGRNALSLDYLPVWLLCAGAADLAGRPVALYLSRQLERRADAYALHRQRRLDVARSALTKLSELNLSHPAPPAWERWLFYTHPTLSERLSHARAILPA